VSLVVLEEVGEVDEVGVVVEFVELEGVEVEFEEVVVAEEVEFEAVEGSEEVEFEAVEGSEEVEFVVVAP